MHIQITVPAAKEKADGMVSVLINVASLTEAQTALFIRGLGLAKFVDHHYVVHDLSNDHVKVLIAQQTTLRDIKALLPDLTIEKNISLGNRVTYAAILDDSFYKLLTLANEQNNARPTMPARARL